MNVFAVYAQGSETELQYGLAKELIDIFNGHPVILAFLLIIGMVGILIAIPMIKNKGKVKGEPKKEKREKKVDISSEIRSEVRSQVIDDKLDKIIYEQTFIRSDLEHIRNKQTNISDEVNDIKVRVTIIEKDLNKIILG